MSEPTGRKQIFLTKEEIELQMTAIDFFLEQIRKGHGSDAVVFSGVNTSARLKDLRIRLTDLFIK